MPNPFHPHFLSFDDTPESRNFLDFRPLLCSNTAS